MDRRGSGWFGVAAWQQKQFAVMMGFDRVQRDPTFGSWSTVGWRFSREPVGRVLAREVVHPDGEWDPVDLVAGECGHHTFTRGHRRRSFWDGSSHELHERRRG